MGELMQGLEDVTDERRPRPACNRFHSRLGPKQTRRPFQSSDARLHSRAATALPGEIGLFLNEAAGCPQGLPLSDRLWISADDAMPLAICPDVYNM